MKFPSLALLFLACSLVNCFSYRGYKLIRVFPNNQQDVKLVRQFENSDENFDIWRDDKNGIDVLLSPNNVKIYSKIFKTRNIKFEILQQDVQSVIDEQKRSMKNENNGKILNTFARYTAVLGFIDDTVDENPDIASAYTTGISLEGRSLRVLQLKTTQATRSIWIDCGIHAREWVTPATCVSFIDRLIREYRNNDPEVVALMNKYEFHILPILNPDGYEYSHTTDRLWRKNRKPNAGSACIGVDLNRNFPYEWNPGSGSSSDPCAANFAGPSAASEPETQGVIAALTAKTGNWDAFFTLHTYGNLWLYPWGYTVDFSDDNTELERIGDIAVNAIKSVNGEDFLRATASYDLNTVSGFSIDWAYGTLGIVNSYLLELRPGEGTPDYSFGFLLPADRLPLVANETYAGIKASLTAILQGKK